MQKFFGDLQYKPLDVLPQTSDFMISNPRIAEDLVRGIIGKMSAKDHVAFWVEMLQLDTDRLPRTAG